MGIVCVALTISYTITYYYYYYYENVSDEIALPPPVFESSFLPVTYVAPTFSNNLYRAVY